MNFSDKLKEISEGYAEDVARTFEEEVKLTEVADPEDLKNVRNASMMPTKELTPTDVVRVGVAIVEDAMKNVDVLRDDKQHAKEWSEMMLGYLETIVSIVFKCNCKIERLEISEEDTDDE